MCVRPRDGRAGPFATAGARETAGGRVSRGPGPSPFVTAGRLVARVCGGRGGRVRAAVRRRRAVSKRGVRRERRGRMISGLCELPAHTLLAAAPRSQPPARARPRGAGLTLSRRVWSSRGADLALGYRFRPPLFARARLPARASYRRWSPICIRHGSSTPHPVSIADCSTMMRAQISP